MPVSTVPKLRVPFIPLGVAIVTLGIAMVSSPPGGMGETNPEDQCQARSIGDRYLCYLEKTREVARREGTEAALRFTNETVRERSTYGTAHIVMHEVGHIAYRQTKDIAEALSYLPPEASASSYFYFEGYLHGVLQAFFANQKKTLPIPDLMEKSCGEYFPIASFTGVLADKKVFGEQCSHALGHALMFAEGNDVPRSLAWCDTLPQAWMYDWCYFGVFMENFYYYYPFYSPESPRPHAKGESMAELCLELKEKYRMQCARFVARTLLAQNPDSLSPGALKDAFGECLRLGEQYLNGCIHYAALRFIAPSFQGDFAKMIQACKETGPLYEGACLEGVAMGVERGEAGFIYKDYPFCDLVEARFRSRCFNFIQTVYVKLDSTIVKLDEDAFVHLFAIEPATWERWREKFQRFVTGETRIPAPKEEADVSGNAFRNLPFQERIASLEGMVQEQGVTKAWQFIKRSYTAPDGSLVDHGSAIYPLTEFLGNRIYEAKNPQGIAICNDAVFAYGCYSGFFKRAVPTLGVHEAYKVCNAAFEGSELKRLMCVRGIGHGLRSENGDLEKALNGCDDFPEKEASSCWKGLFLEHFISSSASEYAREDPWYPCSKVARKYRAQCARIQPLAMLNKLSMTITHVAEECKRQTDPEVNSLCIEGLGVRIGNQSKGNQEFIMKECGSILDKKTRAYCIMGAIGEIIFQRYPGREETAKALCADLPEEFQKECEEKLRKDFLVFEEEARADRAADFLSADYQEQLGILKAVAQDQGPKAAWIFLKSEFLSSQGFAGSSHDTHPLGHFVGHKLYEEFGLSGITECTPEFAFSCYHGVVERMLIEKGLDAIAAARDACYAHVKGTEAEIGGGCVHGIGHGIVSFERLDLAKALAWCDVLSEEYGGRPKDFRFPDTDYCGEGVFMEYMNSAPANAFRQESPWHPCDTVPQKYQPRCARIQAQVMRKRFGMENAEIAKACAKAPEPPMTVSCLEGIGIHVARNVSGGDFEKIKRGCGEIEEHDLRDQCLSIAAREVIHQNYTAWQTTSQKLCEEVRNSETRHACKERLKRSMATYGKIYGWSVEN